LTHHVTGLSGGLASWLVGRTVQRELVRPGDVHTLQFCDTLYEDADAYRFLIAGGLQIFGRSCNWIPAAEDFPNYQVECSDIRQYAGNPAWRDFLRQLRERTAEALPELVWLVEGRDPWELYRDERFLGNSRRDPCAKIGKRETSNTWRRANCDPADSIHYFGIGTAERHRFYDGEDGGLLIRFAEMGWRAEAPLIDRIEGELNPALYAQAAGLFLPRLYKWAAHNNCGGMCCKAGQKHWKARLSAMPSRYWYDAHMESLIAEYLGGDYTFMRDRRNFDNQPLSLADFGMRLMDDPDFAYGPDEEGDDGCACFGG
jgi:hypothetical protein